MLQGFLSYAASSVYSNRKEMSFLLDPKRVFIITFYQLLYLFPEYSSCCAVFQQMQEFYMISPCAWRK